MLARGLSGTREAGLMKAGRVLGAAVFVFLA